MTARYHTHHTHHTPWIRWPAALLASLLAIGTLPSQPARAAKLQLNVAVSHPLMLAGKKQLNYVKVGLQGFQVNAGQTRPSVNVAFVLDKSGSMTGEKIERAKAAVLSAIERLDERDIVSIIAYDSTVRVVLPATRVADQDAIQQNVQSIQAGGRTALFAGVSKGAAELRKFLARERVNRIVLLSDGLANVGPASPSELGALGASLQKESISVTTMGLGLDYNEDLMTQLAARSDGNHIFVADSTDLARFFDLEFDDVLSVAAQEVAISIHCQPGVRPVRVLNCDADITGQDVVVYMNQIYGAQEKYVMLEVEVQPGEVDQSRQIADVSVSYANMLSHATDRLKAAVSVEFTESSDQAETALNPEVMEQSVLQIANKRNEQATELRDRGDIEGARSLLRENFLYLNSNGLRLNSSILLKRGQDNDFQAQNLDGEEWKRFRKEMRRLQFKDQNQQNY